jgi:integrase
VSTIRKIGKYWCIDFKYNRRGHTKSLKVTTRPEALKLQREVDYQIVRKRLDPQNIFGSPSQYIPLYKFTDRFLKDLENRSDNQGSIDAYDYAIKRLYNIIDKNIDIKLLTRFTVFEKILPYLKDKYALGTRRNTIKHLKSVFNKALDWGLIEVNPFAGKDIIPRAEKRQPRYFKSDEIKAMKKYLIQRPPWQYELIFLTMNTGLRKSEVLNLTWDQVDLMAQQLKFMGKGSKERIVPLNKKARDILSKRFSYPQKFIDIVYSEKSPQKRPSIQPGHD